LTVVEDRDDVGVLQAGGGLDLAAKRAERARISGTGCSHDLDRGLCVERLMTTAPDRPHTAFADLLEEDEGTEPQRRRVIAHGVSSVLRTTGPSQAAYQPLTHATRRSSSTPPSKSSGARLASIMSARCAH